MLYIIFFFAVFTILAAILLDICEDNDVKKLNAWNEEWVKLGMPYMCKDINGNFINKK